MALDEEFRNELRRVVSDCMPGLTEGELEDKVNTLFEEAQRIGRRMRRNYLRKKVEGMWKNGTRNVGDES